MASASRSPSTAKAMTTLPPFCLTSPSSRELRVAGRSVPSLLLELDQRARRAGPRRARSRPSGSTRRRGPSSPRTGRRGARAAPRRGRPAVAAGCRRCDGGHILGPVWPRAMAATSGRSRAAFAEFRRQALAADPRRRASSPIVALRIAARRLRLARRGRRRGDGAGVRLRRVGDPRPPAAPARRSAGAAAASSWSRPRRTGCTTSDPHDLGMILLAPRGGAGAAARRGAAGGRGRRPGWSRSCSAPVPLGAAVTAVPRRYALILAYEWTHFLIHTAHRPRSRYYRVHPPRAPAAPLQERAVLARHHQHGQRPGAAGRRRTSATVPRSPTARTLRRALTAPPPRRPA